MAKEVRITVRLAQAGADACSRVEDATTAVRSEVVREALSMVFNHQGNTRELVRRLKQRKGIE